MKPQNTLNNHRNLDKEEQVGGITLPDIKLYQKAIVIKTSWYGHPGINTDILIMVQHREP